MQSPFLDSDYQVAIVGCGPVGAVLANFLGLYGMRTAVFERDTEVYPHPRAVHADDETLRILQATGLFAELAPALGSYNRREYINAKGQVYFETAVPDAKPLGHITDIYFHQPTMDQVLRDGIGRFACVDLFLGHEVASINRQNETGPVELTVRDTKSGQSRAVTADYVIGCDGGRSLVRKAAGIELKDLGFEQPWLVVDTTLNPGETRESANVPFVHRQHCDPAQPISYIPSGVKGHFRWEFMLTGDTAPEQAQSAENIERLLSLVVDPAKFQVDRAAVYTFHSLVAATMRVGRLFLAGDSAHQMPPFAGQGMCCGLRDAHNLAWKLALVLAQKAPETLLDSYSEERIPHVTRMTRGTMLLGNLVQTRNPIRAFLRDMLFKTVFRVPAIYGRVAGFALRPPDLHTGILGGDVPQAAGTRFPQPQVISGQQAEPILLDELIGPGFAIIGLNFDPKDVMRPMTTGPVPVRTFTLVTQPGYRLDDTGTIALQDRSGTLPNWFEKHGAKLVVIRPDRYVFGAYKSVATIDSDLARTAISIP